MDHRLAHHRGRVPGLGAGVVLVHHRGQHRLVQAAPVHPDSHRLVFAQGDFDDLGKLAVALLAEADIAWVDPVLGQHPGSGRFGLQQLVAVVVKISDQRHRHIDQRQLVRDPRQRGRGLGVVDGQPHQFRAGPPQRRHLLDRGRDIGGVGIGHRLHHYRRVAADAQRTDLYRHAAAAYDFRQGCGLAHAATGSFAGAASARGRRRR